MNKRKLRRALTAAMGALHNVQLTEREHAQVRELKERLSATISAYIAALDGRMNGHANVGVDDRTERAYTSE